MKGLFFIEEFQLTNTGGKIELEKSLFSAPSDSVDLSEDHQWLLKPLGQMLKGTLSWVDEADNSGTHPSVLTLQIERRPALSVPDGTQ